MSLVKPAATYLISSAMPFLLSVIFLRSLAIHADYVPSTTARRPGEYYQNQHVAEPMADVPLIRPSS